jgi:hypothetical protein
MSENVDGFGTMDAVRTDYNYTVERITAPYIKSNQREKGDH